MTNYIADGQDATAVANTIRSKSGISDDLTWPDEFVTGISSIPTAGGITPLDVYPVGSIYMSTVDIDPSEIFGGIWQRIEDRFLLAASDPEGASPTYAAGDTDGSPDAVVVSHTHTQEQHRHNVLKYTNQQVASGTAAARIWIQSSSSGNNTGVSNYVTPTINSTGESGTGKNMPPYLVVYMWKRTA